MGIEQYLDVGKPEEKKKISSGENSVSAVAAAFSKWAEWLQESVRYPQIYPLDTLKAEAGSILRAHKNNLPKEIDDTAYFIPITLFLKSEYQQFAGLFYTALLEYGKSLVVPKTIKDPSYWNASSLSLDLCCWGYGLYQGIMVNKGIIGSLGERARTETLFVNEGQVRCFGHWAKGGVFVNRGDVKELSCPICYNSPYNPLVINFGSVDKLFLQYDNIPYSLSVRYEQAPAGQFLFHKGLLLNDKKIKSNKNLAGLIEELRNSKIEDMQNIADAIKQVTDNGTQ